MSSSNCCFLTCIQISQETDQVVWYSHLFKNFPQFIVIHTVKGFGIVNKAEIDVFLELSCFFDDPADVGNLISGSSAFSKSSFRLDRIFKVSHTIHSYTNMVTIQRNYFGFIIWKTQQWPQDWKSQFSFPSQRKAMPKNAQTTTQLHSSHMLVQ